MVDVNSSLSCALKTPAAGPAKPAWVAFTLPSRPINKVAGQVLRLTACGTLSHMSAGAPGDQIGVRHMVLLDESVHARQRSLLIGLFEVESHNLQALVVILRVELDQVLRFVVAVRAPGSGNDRQHHLTLEPRIVVRNDFAVDIREAVGEHFVGIANSGVRLVVRRLRQTFGARHFRPVGDQSRRCAGRRSDSPPECRPAAA